MQGNIFIRKDSLKNSEVVGFYEKENLYCTILTSFEINLDYVEDLWIEIKTTYDLVVVGTVYRHPTNITETYERFSEKLLKIFNDLISNNHTFYALGDYNIDLIKVQTRINIVSVHVNNMISSPGKCAIDLPTRITDDSKTLLDHTVYIR